MPALVSCAQHLWHAPQGPHPELLGLAALAWLLAGSFGGISAFLDDTCWQLQLWHTCEVQLRLGLVLRSEHGQGYVYTLWVRLMGALKWSPLMAFLGESHPFQFALQASFYHGWVSCGLHSSEHLHPHNPVLLFHSISIQLRYLPR